MGGTPLNPRWAPAACGERAQRELKSDCYIHTCRKSTVIPGGKTKQNKKIQRSPHEPKPNHSLPKQGGQARAFLLPQSHIPWSSKVGLGGFLDPFFAFFWCFWQTGGTGGSPLPAAAIWGSAGNQHPNTTQRSSRSFQSFSFLLIFFFFLS